MEFSSQLLENAVYEISQLPGIGKKTALRLALHMLRQDASQVENLSKALVNLRNNINYCKKCHNISDKDVCEICSNPKRDDKILCVVEDIRDVMAIENTGQFSGLYHVLGGKISPMEGVGPQDINIASLISRIEDRGVTEVIFALSSTVEGDTTNFYIFRQIEKYKISTSTIARGISVGDDLEYADEVTLGRSLINRIPYQNTLRK
jgi:recombination protein RecR